ncbi:MAG TPA: hypothetical protein VEU11_12985 [Terriglobales bacterium]|jgi:hypothetical protein|nr:hypothetical protein [Terriglobales bacterium]
MTPNRRDFIKIVVAGSVESACPVDFSLPNAQTAGSKSPTTNSGIEAAERSAKEVKRRLAR